MENWQERNGLLGRMCLLVYNNFTSKWRTGKKKWTFLPDLFTSIYTIIFILVNGELAEKKWTF